jgi:hypothetical protein
MSESKANAYSEMDSVSAGEVCSLEMAKVLGINDRLGGYYDRDRPEYAKIKTYNLDIDRQQNRSQLICKAKDETEAYPLCLLSSNVGAGIGFVPKKGDPNVCITYDCPPGFDSQTKGVCTKPLEDALVSKVSRCDERWHDWFMIPNYHLGNKYYSAEPGKCYAPCSSGNLPNFAKDPVDGSKVDFSSTDQLDKCISRADYFGGKYSSGSEYCPIAWIHRMSVNEQAVRNQLTDDIKALQKDKGVMKNDAVDQVQLENEINSRAKMVVKEASSTFEKVPLPNKDMHKACKTLHTDERLLSAYNVCKSVRDNEDLFMEDLQKNGDSDDIQKKKVAVIKYACNGVFCNEAVDPYVAETIGQDPICFTNIEKVNMRVEEEKTPDVPTAEKGKNFFDNSLKWSIKLFIIVIFGVLAYFFVMDFLWPKAIRPIFRVLRRILTGWRGSKYEDANEELITKLKDRVKTSE